MNVIESAAFLSLLLTLKEGDIRKNHQRDSLLNIVYLLIMTAFTGRIVRSSLKETKNACFGIFLRRVYQV